jgi:hypothetical protein
MEYCHIDIGPVPAGESFAQVGCNNYLATSLRECEVFRRMLLRLFPIPEGVRVKYVIRVQPREFGYYRQVAIGFAADQKCAVDFADQVELALPQEWDSIAQYELVWFETRDAYRAAVRAHRLKPQEVPEAYAAKDPPCLPATAQLAELLQTHPL